MMAAFPTGFTETDATLSPQTAAIFSMQSVNSTTEKVSAKPFFPATLLPASGLRSMRKRAREAAQAITHSRRICLPEQSVCREARLICD